MPGVRGQQARQEVRAGGATGRAPGWPPPAALSLLSSRVAMGRGWQRRSAPVWTLGHSLALGVLILGVPQPAPHLGSSKPLWLCP